MEERHYHRRNLPHLYYNDGIYFITYRLNNSIPNHLLKELHEEFVEARKNPTKLDLSKQKIFKKYDHLLDENILNCSHLIIPEIAEINKKTLHYPDNKDYALICYCVMPNHIHVVFRFSPYAIVGRFSESPMHFVFKYQFFERNRVSLYKNA